MGARFNRWFLNKLSGTLELELRETVLGDLEELKVSNGRAVCELLDLLLRRQMKQWKNWRPWLALLGIVWPITWLLTNLSGDVASGLNIQTLAYWKYGVFYGTGLTGQQEILTLACQSLAIVLWSWTAGWALGTLSDGAVWMNRTLLCLIWFFHGKVIYFICLYLWAAVAFKHPGAVKFPLHLLLYPAVLLLLLLLPAFSGIRLAVRRSQIGIKLTIFVVAAIATLTTLVTLTEGWQLTALEKWSMGALHYPTPGWEQRLLPLLVLSWPAAYLLWQVRDAGESAATAA